MKQATLCLFLNNNKQNKKEILLAMKKRGFGIGKWNGVGGKMDLEKGDKSISDAAIRETKEEIGLDIQKMEKVAILKFRFPYKEDWNQDVHVFLAKKWQGDPIETEEMAPKWFKENEISYSQMWDDDKYWLPKVLAGKKIDADIEFKENSDKVGKINFNQFKEA